MKIYPIDNHTENPLGSKSEYLFVHFLALNVAR